MKWNKNPKQKNCPSNEVIGSSFLICVMLNVDKVSSHLSIQQDNPYENYLKKECEVDVNVKEYTDFV